MYNTDKINIRVHKLIQIYHFFFLLLFGGGELAGRFFDAVEVRSFDKVDGRFFGLLLFFLLRLPLSES